MVEGRFIRLLKPVKTKYSLKYYLDYSKNLQEYLSSNYFYVKYEWNISKLKNGILNIPGIGCLFSLALITGAELFVDELDEQYQHSLKSFEQFLKKHFPELLFTGKLVVDKPVKTEQQNRTRAVMFSGGVDSTHLYTKMRHIKPELYTIIGGTISAANKGLIREFKSNIQYFAEKEGVKGNFVETNIGQVINEGLLTARYGRSFIKPEPTWWGKINQGLIPLSICAPLTFLGKVSSVHMTTSNYSYPDGAHPKILKTIFWSGTRVIPDIDDSRRFDKIKKVCDTYTEKDTRLPKFQICTYSPVYSNLLNCGSCDKCLSTIVSLIVLGLDPRRHGFPIIEGLYKHLREQAVPKTDTPHHWARIQEEVKEKNYPLPDSDKDFFKWFKEFQFKEDAEKTLHGQRIKCRLMTVTTRLPRSIQDLIMEKYYKTRYMKNISSPAVKDIPTRTIQTCNND